MCYIEPVLTFGTEQDIIVNSHCLISKCSQRLNKLESGECHKECLLRKRYCLSEFENKLSDRLNQVLAKEYSGCLLIYILVRYESKRKGHESEMVKRVIDKTTHVLDSRKLSNQR
jgi:hypothetical protein